MRESSHRALQVTGDPSKYNDKLPPCIAVILTLTFVSQRKCPRRGHKSENQCVCTYHAIL